LISDNAMPGFVVTDSVAGGFRNIRSASATAVPVQDSLSWNQDDEDRAEFQSARARSNHPKSAFARHNLPPYYSDTGPTETFGPVSRGPATVLLRGTSVPESPIKSLPDEERYSDLNARHDTSRPGEGDIRIENRDTRHAFDDVVNDDNDNEDDDDDDDDAHHPLLGPNIWSPAAPTPVTPTTNTDDTNDSAPLLSGSDAYMGLEVALATKYYLDDKEAPENRYNVNEKTHGAYQHSPEMMIMSPIHSQVDRSMPDVVQTDPTPSAFLATVPKDSISHGQSSHVRLANNASEPGNLSETRTPNSGRTRSPNVQFDLDTPEPNSSRSKSLELLMPQPVQPDPANCPPRTGSNSSDLEIPPQPDSDLSGLC
uniref:Serine/threonine protein kinase n=1 Tax=Echinostoma caproni TaxID=27848 RepID=A0A183AUP8_9TREM